MLYPILIVCAVPQVSEMAGTLGLVAGVTQYISGVTQVLAETRQSVASLEETIATNWDAFTTCLDLINTAGEFNVMSYIRGNTLMNYIHSLTAVSVIRRWHSSVFFH